MASAYCPNCGSKLDVIASSQGESSRATNVRCQECVAVLTIVIKKGQVVMVLADYSR